MDGPIRFELDRLVSYDEASITNELRRVAALGDGPLTREAFRPHSRVDTSTVVRRFGGWKNGLEAAGLGGRYSGRNVSAKMRSQPGRGMTDEEIIAELRRVAAEVAPRPLTVEAFRERSTLLSEAAARRRFGSWSKALRRAGLELSRYQRRWTDDDYFENLLAVWTHYGRPPTYSEMNRTPSRITANGYAAKFGTWTKAKVAFVERVNADLAEQDGQQPNPTPIAEQLRLAASVATRSTLKPEDRRDPSIGLRYTVLARDRFRCSLCGRSPATDLSIELHVDHIVPVAAGGKTTGDNLRALCSDCNLGKGSKLEAR